MKLVVTRPRPHAEKTAERLRALGHEVLVEPLLIFQALPFSEHDLSRFDAIAITSSRALEALRSFPNLSFLKKLPIYCVGEQTARAAKSFGFVVILTAGGHVDALAARIVEEGKAKKLIYLAASDRSGDLSGLLAPHEISCSIFEVYRMEPCDHFSGPMKSAIAREEVDCALFYSRRTAEAFARIVRLENLDGNLYSIDALCISQGVAEPLSGLMPTRVSREPTEQSLFALLEKVRE